MRVIQIEYGLGDDAEHMSERLGPLDILLGFQEAFIKIQAMEFRVIIALLDLLFDNLEHCSAPRSIPAAQLLGGRRNRGDDEKRRGREQQEGPDP